MARKYRQETYMVAQGPGCLGRIMRGLMMLLFIALALIVLAHIV